jgi:hypothetical protein
VKGARVRFDHEAPSSQSPAPEGCTCPLADDWLLDSSPEAELNFALVRLAERVGDVPVPADPSQSLRRWLKSVGPTFELGESVLIPHYAETQPLRLAIG